MLELYPNHIHRIVKHFHGLCALLFTSIKMFVCMYDCIIVDARDVEIHITRDPRCVYHCNGVRFPRGGYKRPGSDP